MRLVWRPSLTLLLIMTAEAQAAPQQQAVAQSSCIECHLRQQGALHDVVEAWRGSVHEKAGIGCEGCHGGDLTDERLAHSPSANFIGRLRLREFPYFCGKCHAEIRDKHVGSVHGANGLPHCVSCHGDHAVQPPDAAQIINEADCNKCHPYEKAETVRQMLDKAHGLLTQLEGFTKDIQHLPGVTKPLREMQQQLRLDPLGIATTLHSFRIGEIQQIGNNADRLIKTIGRLREREEQRQSLYAEERPLILMLMGFAVLCALFGYLVYHGKPGATRSPASEASKHV